jgi:hypothetical protein
MLRIAAIWPRVGSECRKNLRKFATNCLWIVALYSCVSPTDFEIERIGGRLVISGQVSTAPERTFVELGTIAGTARLPNPVSGALVEVVDEGGLTHPLFESRIGFYTSSFVASPGKAYMIRVTHVTGQVYESKPEIVPSAATFDVTSYDFSLRKVVDPDGIATEKTFINVYVTNTSLHENEPYIKWEAEEVYIIEPTDYPDERGMIPDPCYVRQNADPQRVVILNRANLSTNEIKNLLVASRLVDQSFHTRHYFQVYHGSITREAYEYWNKVNILSNNVGSIFDTPPAEIRGNLTNTARKDDLPFGYFQAVNETMNRFYLLEPDLPFRLRDYCEYLPFRSNSDYPSECMNCLLVRNSTIVRPEWF